MDTKSKKFKYKPLKAVAFLLCLAFTAAGALSAYRLADFTHRSGYYFGSDRGLSDAANNLYDVRLSKSYLDEVGFVYYAAKRVFITYRNGTVFSDGTLERELDPLLKIKDAYPKMLIARTKHEETLAEGVRVVDIARWLDSTRF